MQQQISEVMTRNVRVVSPDDTLQAAAQVMDELNVGAVPVCTGERLVGMITDRDITVRAVASGLPADGTPVKDVMTEQVRWCFEDQDVDEVMQQMSDVQIRRMPVVDRTVLRIAVYELLHEPDVPQVVIVDEAIELAKRYGSEQSGAFVNGVLDGLLHTRKYPGRLH